MRRSSEILRAIRVDVFDDTQERFGKRLQLNNETISRLESGKGHRVTKKHLRWLKLLKAPKDQAARLQELLQQMEAALELEAKAEAGVGPAFALAGATAPAEGMPAVPVDARQAELIAKAEDAARRAEEAVQRTEQLRIAEEARYAAELQRLEAATRRTEEIAERVEQLHLAEEARRAEELKRLEAATRRTEEIAERVERMNQAEEARRAEEDRKREEAARRNEELRANERRFFKRVAVAVAASGVLELAGGGVAWFKVSGATSQITQSGAGEHEGVMPGRETAREEGSPDTDKSLSSNLDGGTELSKLVANALPMPTGALRGQLAAPCPEGIEAINGYCWVMWSLTTTQVKAGLCDTLGLYEPSEGWCRAHHAGYKPFLGFRRPNNTVEGQ